MPCTKEKKRRIFHDIEKKNRVRREEKNIRAKIERKGKKTRKERRELVRKSMHQ